LFEFRKKLSGLKTEKYMLLRLFIIFVILLVSACNENGSVLVQESGSFHTTPKPGQSFFVVPSFNVGWRWPWDLSDPSPAPNASEQSEAPSSRPTEVQEVSSLTEIQGQKSAGLKGTDDNANGIRDDIDQFIEQKFSYTPEIKRAAEQEARALQQFMEAQTKEEALKAAEQMARATSCTFKRLSDPIRDYEKRQALSKEIEVWTTNTKERLFKYLESSKLIGGAYFMQPIEPVCD
jgi:hypothetical protein